MMLKSGLQHDGVLEMDNLSLILFLGG